MVYDNEDFRELAWEVISRLSIGQLLEDCVEALVEAYNINEDLFLQDKQMLLEIDPYETTRDISMPIHTYINTVIEKEQEEQDVSGTE